MKLDRLEEFVKDHRAEFDDLEPGKDLFNEIEFEDKKIINLHNWKIVLRIAAALIIFSLGFALNEIMPENKKPGNEGYANDESLIENDSLMMAFEEMQVYYTSQINIVKNDIILLSNADQEISNELDLQMKDFNLVLKELLSDLKDQANDEEVIEAMILNYRVKLRLLEDMKDQLNTSTIEGEEVKYETIDI
jgi:hypothetical protein